MLPANWVPFTTADESYAPAELLDFKFCVVKRKGYKSMEAMALPEAHLWKIWGCQSAQTIKVKNAKVYVAVDAKLNKNGLMVLNMITVENGHKY